MIWLDRMVQVDKILRMTRSISGEAAAGPRPAVRLELVDRIMDEFHHFIGELRCAGTERLVRAGVSMSHLYVMGLLSQHGDAAMSRVAELLDVSLSNATGMVDRMEERGFVERVRVADDRRVVLVRLTDAGRVVLDEADIVRRELIERLLARLDGVQLERLSMALVDVHAAVAGLIAEDDPGGCPPLGIHGRHHPQAHAHAHPNAHEDVRANAHRSPVVPTPAGRGPQS